MRHSLSFVFLFFVLPGSAHAAVVISEFLYDAPGSDTGKEWIELINTGSNPVDISKWKVNDGSNHILNAPPKNGSIGSMSIAPGAYLILVSDATGFISRYPGIGSVIDTTLNFPNAGGTISIRDASSTIINSVSYSKSLGAAGDGNSLQKTSAGSWISAEPTPGVVNVQVASPPSVPVVSPTKASVKKSANQVALKSKSAARTDSKIQGDTVPHLADAQPELVAPASVVQEAASASSMDWTSPWFLGAAGLAGASAVASFIARKSKKKEWDIEEMSDEV
jgi:hypothetical protein